MLTYFLLAFFSLFGGLLLSKLTGINWIWLVGLMLFFVFTIVFIFMAIQWLLDPPMEPMLPYHKPLVPA